MANTEKVKQVKEIGGFKLATTRKNKEGNLLHVLDTATKIRREQPKHAGDLQLPEAIFEIDEKAKIVVRIKNAYELGIVEFVGQRAETYKKTDKKTGEAKQITRNVNEYNCKPFTFIQGDDGNLYLIVGAGKKANGTMTEGWANLSAFARNLVAPKVMLDLTKPQKSTFAIDDVETSFFAVQVNNGIREKSEKAIKGYKLSLVGTVGFDEEEITAMPYAQPKAKVETTVNEDEF